MNNVHPHPARRNDQRLALITGLARKLGIAVVDLAKDTVQSWVREVVVEHITVPDEVCDMKAAEEVTGLSGPTLLKLVRAGELRAFRVGRQWRFRRSDLLNAGTEVAS